LAKKCCGDGMGPYKGCLSADWHPIGIRLNRRFGGRT
jgi:hypothetical protein